MIDARLSLALDGAGLAWPEDGRIAVFRPPHGADLPGIPQDRTVVLQDFKPDFDDFAERGFDCAVAAEGRYAAAVVCLPRAKRDARALVAQAAKHCDGVVVIDGQKTDGIDGFLREMRKRTTVHGPISKAHGKLFWTDALAGAFDDWDAGPELTDGGFWTAPGVFSADGIDPASDLLAQALPQKLGTTVVDLGAGWGYLAANVLTRASVEEMHLVEAGHMALECARHNVTDPRAVFHWQDARQWRAPGKVDCVVMNPPFHTTRAAEPSLGQAFVAAAAAMLSPGGQLWMVANRHLPYESTLQAQFAKVTELSGDTRFKLFNAARPLRRRG